MVVAITVLFAVSGVRAELWSPTPPARTCNTLCSSVVAGPCLSGMQGCNGTLAPDFPRIVNCPAECNGAKDAVTNQLLSGQFLRWDYLIIGTSKCSPSLIGVQVAENVEIEASVGGNLSGSVGSVNNAPSPPGTSTEMGVGQNDWDSVWLKFPANATPTNPFLAAYFTQVGVKVGQEGVVTKSGNTIMSCGVAGAGIPAAVNANAALYTDYVFTTPGPCTATYKVTPPPDCKAIPNSLQLIEGSSSDCAVTETANSQIDGKDILNISTACPVVTFTQPGSCSYCVYNTYGGKTCCTCTSCCVRASDGVCVKASTLSSPLTQCKAGTCTNSTICNH